MSDRRPKLSTGDRVLVTLVGLLGPALIRLLGRTWRVTIVGGAVVESVHAGGRSVVFAFWHGQLLPLEYLYRGRRIHVLSSWHRDGEISARLMTALGFGVVRGSTSTGSARGLLGMLAKAREGLDVAITPDGPRGPARSVKRGIFFLAEKARSPIVPLAVAARPSRRLSSWDRFIVPLPFSRVAVVFGEPIEPREDSPLGEKSLALAEELKRLEAAAEALLGAPGASAPPAVSGEGDGA
jgi:lysophospholipid acyltransferase (LPLAT)-like uncharacterized protein